MYLSLLEIVSLFQSFLISYSNSPDLHVITQLTYLIQWPPSTFIVSFYSNYQLQLLITTVNSLTNAWLDLLVFHTFPST